MGEEGKTIHTTSKRDCGKPDGGDYVWEKAGGLQRQDVRGRELEIWHPHQCKVSTAGNYLMCGYCSSGEGCTSRSKTETVAYIKAS